MRSYIGNGWKWNNRMMIEQGQYGHLDDAPLPITICAGENLIIRYANKCALSLFRKVEHELIDNPLTTVFPDLIPVEVSKRIYRECLVGGQTVRNVGRRNGSLSSDARAFEITTQPIREGASETACTISYFKDVTDQFPQSNGMTIERPFSQLFRNAPVGIVCYRGRDFIVDYANDKALEMWGKTFGEVQGKAIDEIFPEVRTDDTIRMRHAESLARLERGEVHIVDEVPLVFAKDGIPQRRWFSYIHEPYRDAEGKLTGMIAVAIDITEQVLARDKQRSIADSLEQQIKKRTGELEDTNAELEKRNSALINSQSFLKQIIDSSIEIIAVVDRDLNLLTVNAAFENAAGARADQVIGRSINDVFPAAPDGPRAKALAAALEGKVTNVNTHQSSARRDIFVDTHFIPLRIQGSIEGVIIMARDVSKIVKVERELQNAVRQLQDAQRLTKLGSWEWNVATGNVDWSDEMYRIYGYPEKFPVDFNKATERMRPEDAAHSQERTKRFMADAMAGFKATGERFFDISPLEFTVYLPDGSEKQLRSSGKIELTADGEMYRMLGAIQDVTEIRSTERQLAATNEELREKNTLLDSILSNSSNGISVSRLIFDENGEVIDAQTILANESAIKFIGLPRDLYLTKPATFFDPNIMTSSYGIACVNTLKSGEPFITQYFLEYSARWLELTVSKMDESHLIHIFTDVTAIKESQLKLEQSLEELRRTNANLEDFAYAASHDLKEPLRKFQFFISRLRGDLESVTTENQRSLFTKLESTSNRMKSLVDDLLQYSQLTKGSAEPAQIDLNVTLKNVLEDLELEIVNKRATIVAALLPTIRANGRQFEQVFQNLVGNALKYSRAGVDPMIDIRYSIVNGHEVLSNKPLELLSQKYHQIEISDNGIGFDQIHADRIFKIFTRLHGKDEYSGSGIGLSIVQKIIESHNGFVWATGIPDQGSSFRFILPVEDDQGNGPATLRPGVKNLSAGI